MNEPASRDTSTSVVGVGGIAFWLVTAALVVLIGLIAIRCDYSSFTATAGIFGIVIIPPGAVIIALVKAVRRRNVVAARWLAGLSLPILVFWGGVVIAINGPCAPS